MLNPHRMTSQILLLATSLGSLAGALAQAAPVRWNATEMGVVGDGTTDDTAALQKVLDAARDAGGGLVELPGGSFRIKGTLSIPGGVTLQGTYRVPPTRGNSKVKPDGTTLLAYAGRGSREGLPFIRLAGSNAAIAGLVVVYPEWKQTDVPPVPYPPCVLAERAENVGVSECCLLNPYEAIKLVHAARHLVRNVTGYPICRGIYVDECYDIGHIENIHFWPFGVHYKPDDPYCLWINTQGVAFELARTDWHYVLNTFCFGYGVGYNFSQSKAGSTNGNFLGLGADSCRRAVLVEQAQQPGLLITNGEFVGRWGSTDSICLEITPQVEGKVSLVNCSFWGPIDRCVAMRASRGQFTASACHFVHWDNHGQDAPAIHLEAGRAIVQGSTFNHEGVAVQVEPPVTSAILTGNQAVDGFRVENRAGARTQMAINEVDALVWTDEARAHYQVQVGAAGDGRYLRGWHGREGRAKTYRWSRDTSQLLLPVLPGKAYTITLELTAHKHAIDENSGLYLDGKRLAPLTSGAPLVAQLPAGNLAEVRLELRSKGWVPQAVHKSGHDARTLGIQLHAITMQAAGAGPKAFGANTGERLSTQEVQK